MEKNVGEFLQSKFDKIAKQNKCIEDKKEKDQFENLEKASQYIKTNWGDKKEMQFNFHKIYLIGTGYEVTKTNLIGTAVLAPLDPANSQDFCNKLQSYLDANHCNNGMGIALTLQKDGGWTLHCKFENRHN